MFLKPSTMTETAKLLWKERQRQANTFPENTKFWRCSKTAKIASKCSTSSTQSQRTAKWLRTSCLNTAAQIWRAWFKRRRTVTPSFQWKPSSPWWVRFWRDSQRFMLLELPTETLSLKMFSWTTTRLSRFVTLEAQRWLTNAVRTLHILLADFTELLNWFWEFHATLKRLTFGVSSSKPAVGCIFAELIT